MPTISSACPECAAIVAIPTTAFGKTVRCPKCKHAFRARRSRPDDSDVAEVVPVESTRRPRRRHRDDDPPAERSPAGRGVAVALVVGLVLLGGFGVAAFFLFGNKPDATSDVAQLPPLRPVLRPEQPPPFVPPPVEPPVNPPEWPVAEEEVKVPELPPEKDRPLLVLDSGGHTSMIRATLFTPDGQLLVTVGNDKIVRFWDVATGEMVRVVRPPVGPGMDGFLNAAALSPDGKVLAVGGLPIAGATGVPIFLLDVPSGRLLHVLRGHRSMIMALAFAPDGGRLAATGEDGTILLYASDRKFAEPPYSVKDRPPVTLRGHAGPPRAVAFSPDGTALATASPDKTARIWELDRATGPDNPRVLRGETGDACNAVAWSPDGKTVATGGVDSHLRLWSRQGQLVRTVEFAAGSKDEPVQFTSLAYTKDGTGLLYTGVGFGGRTGILDVATGKPKVRCTAHSNTVITGGLSADGQFAATGGGNDHEVVVWSPTSGEVVHRLVGGGKGVWAIGWSPDGKALAWGNTNRGDTVRATMPLEHAFRLDDLDRAEAPDAGTVRAKLSDGTWTVSALDFFKFRVQHRDGPEKVVRATAQDLRTYCATLLPKDRLVLGGVHLVMLDLTTGKPLRQFHGHSGIVISVATSPDGKWFATGSADQTIRIWSPERDAPVLSLFFVGQDWIAWTPEGYYASSAHGERLMGWQKNNGPEALGSYFPASRFRASLFHPEALKLLLPAGSLPRALAQAARGKPPAAGFNVAQVLPPEVTLTLPPGVGNAPLADATVEVTGVATSVGAHPVTALRLLVDGRPYQGSKGVKPVAAPRLGQVSAGWTVALSPGKHTLTVLAETAVSKGMSAPVELTRAGDPSDKPNLYVLAAGVSAYPGPMRLRFAASDAELIARTFQERSTTTFGKVEVRVVTDAEATRQGLLDGLQWLEERMTPQDVGVFFFSGHGGRDDAGNFFLVPVDVSQRNPTGSCLNGEVVRKALSDMPGKLIAVLDCCHSGSVAENMRSGRADNLVRDLVAEENGVVVMCSSLGREYSLESTQTRAGFYTLGLVEGLSGQADYNRDRVVHIHELDAYSARRVRELSQGRQNPVVGKPAAIRSFPLAREGP